MERIGLPMRGRCRGYDVCGRAQDGILLDSEFGALTGGPSFLEGTWHPDSVRSDLVGKVKKKWALLVPEMVEIGWFLVGPVDRNVIKHGGMDVFAAGDEWILGWDEGRDFCEFSDDSVLILKGLKPYRTVARYGKLRILGSTSGQSGTGVRRPGGVDLPDERPR
ncbi:hypothetical protein C7212DRAFT_348669 [Tuber magnatum]|uniref:Uncharacterized protein n=1 Tax=Tuber magnatum TaxID=42249 RepID=A0A317SBQ2_9PEZI|nr:hypothetical protein C7212DRAFT_348669 [Tuber magnatum]